MLAEQAEKVRTELAQHKDVAGVRVMSRTEVENLVRPWLGSGAAQDDLPLPALLAMTVRDTSEDAIAAITEAARRAEPTAVIETHRAWLSDLRRFSLVLLLAAGAMAVCVIACCILSVAGAVKARLAAHHSDIDLLHVMGATDDYIGLQFVRVVVRSVGTAALAGTAAGVIFLKIAGIVAGSLQSAMLPAFSWDAGAWLAFIALPALVTALCFAAARFTVLRTLRIMP